MSKNKSVRMTINEMRRWLDDTPMVLEGFFLPEEDEDMDFGPEGPEGPDGYDEVPPRRGEKPEMGRSEIEGIEKELTQIRKIALSVINRLADQPQSPQYDTMKKIWNMVDKAIEQPQKGQVGKE